MVILLLWSLKLNFKVFALSGILLLSQNILMEEWCCYNIQMNEATILLYILKYN